MTISKFQFKYLPKWQFPNYIHNFLGTVVQSYLIQRFLRPVNPKVRQKRKLIVPQLNIVGYFSNAFYFYDVHFGSWTMVDSP